MAEEYRHARVKQRALSKRDAAAGHIHFIYELAMKAKADSDQRQHLLVAVEDLNFWWKSFSTENDALLDAMIELGEADQFTHDAALLVQRECVEAKAVARQSDPATKTVVVGQDGTAELGAQLGALTCTSRLPDIPLPKFDGQLKNWPDFRDRFKSLIHQRQAISNVEKFYYLLSCLDGDPSEVLKGITVAEETYSIAWSTLVEAYDKPRRLAANIIEDMLKAPVINNESVQALQGFITVFDEGIATLNAMKIPDIASFLLFNIAARCLPAYSRRLFETDNSREYPAIEDLIKFVKARINILENAGLVKLPAPVAGKSAPTPQRRPTTETPKYAFREKRVAMVSTTKGSTSAQQSSSSNKCYCCSESHALQNCTKFQGLSIDGRYDVATKYRLCLVCFGNNHMSYKCPSACSICSRRHHALLHRDQARDQPSTSKPAPVSLVAHQGLPSILLGTALVQIKDVAGHFQSVRALIDSGSQISALSSSCCKRLGLFPSRWTVPVTGLSGQKIPNVQGIVDISVKPLSVQLPLLEVKAWVLPIITADLPTRQLPNEIRSKCDHLSLADPLFDSPAPVDLLIGADIFPQVWHNETQQLGPGLPSAYGSIFGWVLIGPVQPSIETPVHSLVATLPVSLESLMEKFWTIEDPAPAPMDFTEDGQCEAVFNAEMYRNYAGEYFVPLPFRLNSSVQSFPGMREVALRRFFQLERKLQRDPVLHNAYKAFMKEYEELGHMSRSEEPGDYFIPHHAVHKLVGDDIKLRVVFDASAKCQAGYSLNDQLYVGPKLQQEIVDVLLGFRLHKVVFTTDICKMYRQIWVHDKYRGFQHILWRELAHEQVKEYTLHTVTYGVNCAPYLALRVIQHIADNECEDFLAVKQTLKCQTYIF